MRKYKHYNKARVYDGHNCDLSFQLTYIGIKKKKFNNRRFSKNIIIDNYILKEKCKEFYKLRMNNYKQMVSDFTNFQLIQNVDVNFFPPIVIKHDDDYLLCIIKVDDFYNYRFVKFQLKVLSNDICFYDYLGDINNYIENEISSKNGYSFYVNNKRKKFSNLKAIIRYYLKKLKVDDKFYSMDNIIALTDNLNQASNKYLRRNNLGKNLFIRNLGDDHFYSIYGIFMSKKGNILYIIRNSNNPYTTFSEEYNKLLPIIENSYDIIKQYILLNQYLRSKYENYYTYNLKTKQLKKDFEIVCFYQKFRNILLNDSMDSVAYIIKEFERQCVEIDFSNRSNNIKKYIVREFQKRKISISEFISSVTSKTIAEIYDKTIDKFN